MNYPQELITRIFPNPLPSIEELEAKFPARDVAEGAVVTRVAPSPTGFMHIGTLYTGLIAERLAHQSSGVFFLRIEDTDKKREVAGAADLIAESFKHYELTVDEGRQADGTEMGEYGPYTQSARADLYAAVVKHLLEQGKAYLSFETPEELEEIRAKQQAAKVPTGYYGEWAVARDFTHEKVMQKLDEGLEYVIRFRSEGDSEKRLDIKDKILGKRELPENTNDVVIMKSTGLPTYHMAHVVDDHFMRTSLVIRGGEWFPSLPLHIQLFVAMGWKVPKFAHLMPINKLEDGSRRKLSKRKDPESNIQYFTEAGYPTEAIIEYLLNLANSTFEVWREQNQDKHWTEFEVTYKGLQQSSGPLFDFVKLADISKGVLSRLSAEVLFARLVGWAEVYDQDFHARLTADEAYATAILSIERGGKKARKDNATYADFSSDIAYFFDDSFNLSEADFLSEANTDLQTAKAVVNDFLATYDPADETEAWFAKVKDLAEARGFAVRTRDFKDNPENYAGSISDMVKILRVLLTGRSNTPDLHAIMQVMGEERVRQRLTKF